jgi:hypothetical protein
MEVEPSQVQLDGLERSCCGCAMSVRIGVVVKVEER